MEHAAYATTLEKSIQKSKEELMKIKERRMMEMKWEVGATPALIMEENISGKCIGT